MTASELPLVSVIVPCYNYGRFVEYALDSVKQQTYASWECIIVDDGSTDDTRQVAEKFVSADPRFKYFFQENAGLSAARNTGLSNAGGRYIQFLDADDLLHKDKLRLQAEFLKKHPEADLVYGNAVFFKDNDRQDVSVGNLKRDKINRLKISGKGARIIRNLVINNFMEVSAPLLRRELIERVGIFKPVYRTYEDWQYWFRAAQAGAFFTYIPLPGTETYIRYGHSSMLGNAKTRVHYGIMIRKFWHSSLGQGLKLYNNYRLFKLYVKQAILSVNAKIKPANLA